MDWADRLLGALIADLRNAEPTAFLGAFDSLIERLLTGGADVNACHDVLGALRAQVVPILRSDRARGERAEDLFHLCRVATSQGIQRRLMRERLTLGRFSRTLSATCAALASSVEPSWNRTPVRSLNVQTSPPAFAAQLTARSGVGSPLASGLTSRL